MLGLGELPQLAPLLHKIRRDLVDQRRDVAFLEDDVARHRDADGRELGHSTNVREAVRRQPDALGEGHAEARAIERSRDELLPQGALRKACHPVVEPHATRSDGALHGHHRELEEIRFDGPASTLSLGVQLRALLLVEVQDPLDDRAGATQDPRVVPFDERVVIIDRN